MYSRDGSNYQLISNFTLKDNDNLEKAIRLLFSGDKQNGNFDVLLTEAEVQEIEKKRKEKKMSNSIERTIDNKQIKNSKENNKKATIDKKEVIEEQPIVENDDKFKVFEF